jgi:hypothetical protein
MLRSLESRSRLLWATLAILGFAAAAQAQLRVATWNISNYTGGKVADIQTAVYDVYAGRLFAPDIILAQEIQSSSAAATFRNALNSAAGSPGDWEYVYVSGTFEGNVMLYRTSKVEYQAYSIASPGGAFPNGPRPCVRYKVRMQGYDAFRRATLFLYNSHMKAGSSGDDKTRRLTEATNIRDDAEGLHPDYHFLFGADLNIQSSLESAYLELVGVQANNDGRFFDPIKTPGSWNNNCSYNFVHTQDPSGAGGMDDRYDQILVSGNLVDGTGFEYIGNPDIPYSSVTWNDPNHSYRSWGNDGTTCNGSLATFGNSMVGPDIAQALKNLAGSGGHLPVFLDLRVPPQVTADLVVDFGTVTQGSQAEAEFRVSNAGDVGLVGELPGYSGPARYVMPIS